MKIFFTNKIRFQHFAGLFPILNILLISVFFSNEVHAYVDPGSGGVIVTTVLGLIAAVGYTARKYFYRIKRIILNRMGQGAEKEGKEADNQH